MGSTKVSQLHSSEVSSDVFSRMILAGLLGIVFVETYAAVMQREFQNTNNRVGKGFAILGIYLFVVTYCEFSMR